jgi:hypothetical protein
MTVYEFQCPACGTLQKFSKGGGICPNCQQNIILPPMGRPWLKYTLVWVVAFAAAGLAYYYKPSRIRARAEAEKQRVEDAKKVEAGKAALQSMHEGLDRARQSAERAKISQQQQIADSLKSYRPTTMPAK